MEPEKSSTASTNQNNKTIVMVYIGETEHKDKVFQQWVEIKENDGDPLPQPAEIRMWRKLEEHRRRFRHGLRLQGPAQRRKRPHGRFHTRPVVSPVEARGWSPRRVAAGREAHPAHA